MQRLLLTVAVTILALTFHGCKKAQEMEDTPLTGSWIKGTNAGDTLYFTKNNGRNILRYNASFNPVLAVVTETEYRYQDNQLSIRNFMAAQNDFYMIPSFKWIEEGKEFEVLGYQIFPFMSSMSTRFTYRKLN